MKLQPRRTAMLLLVCAALVAPHFSGCASPSDTESATESAEPQPVGAEEFERLRALGYVELADPLPPDARTGVLLHDRERARAGLNLFTNAHFCSTQLMDMEGRILHSWSREPCHRWGNPALLDNGDLVVMGRLPHEKDQESARESRYLMKMSWDGEVLWDKDLAAHHDVDLTPNGELLTLTYELVLHPKVSMDTPLRDNLLVLLTTDGEILEQVSLWDLLHSNPDVFTMQQVPYREFEGGWEVDAFHANAVEWMRDPQLIANHPLYDENSVLICVRNQDTVALLDWPTKKLTWAWGQGEIVTPHDATVLPSGNILVFDNGLGRQWSRVVEVEPLTRKVVWEYKTPDPTDFYSATRGANQRLSGGNTLIIDSDSGRVFEVDAENRIVWDFLNPNITDKREPSVIVRLRRFEGVTFSELVQSIESGRGLPVRVD